METNPDENRYYNIGGITLRVMADLPITENTFHPNFAQLRVSSPSLDIVSIRHHFSLPEIKQELFSQPVYYFPPWAIYRTKNSWGYLSTGFDKEDSNLHQVAFFTPDHASGEIYHLNGEAFLRGSLRSLTLLPSDQILLAQLLAGRQGCILHSAGMRIDNRGFLFAGHSGAGKSTILDMLKDIGQATAGDRNILRFHNDGLRLYGFFHSKENMKVSATPTMLKGIFLLEQSSENRLINITERRELVRRLLPLVIKSFTTAEWWEKTLDLVGKIAREVPVYRLQFDRSGQVIDLLSTLL